MESAESRQPRRSLTQQVIEGLRVRIEGDELPVGSKLPTEVALIQEFGVSRTVIREAIAGLKADGLVEPRHGVGVFVTRPSPSSNVARLFTVDTERLSSLIEAFELRAAVEVEAAGLAAERRSPAQLAKIQEAFQQISKTAAAGEPVADVDFDFHMAIAEAANNNHFCEFLKHLGRRTIPRSSLPDTSGEAGSSGSYPRKVHNEHLMVAEAISEQNPVRAREAMRVHLKGSQERYSRLMMAG